MPTKRSGDIPAGKGKKADNCVLCFLGECVGTESQQGGEFCTLGRIIRLCRLNLAVHGLEGEIKHGGNINSYYDDPHDATGRFDFVLANPPFNVNAVDTAMRVSARRHPEGTPQNLPERQDHEPLKDMVGPGRRFPFGLPRTYNANYLWIQLFYFALKNGEAGTSGGRAGFVMANSASDACSSEQEFLRQLIAN